jgi:hypothetical protein
MPDVHNDPDLEFAEVKALGRQVMSPDWRAKFTATLHSRANDLPRWSRVYQAENLELWLTSIHEAGHACCAYLAVHQIVTVGAIGSGNTMGRALYNKTGIDTYHERLLISMCGPAAEELVSGRFHLAGSDRTKVTEILSESDDSWTSLVRLERCDGFRRVLCEAREFVTQHRAAITLLACMVAEFGIMGSRCVDEIFSLQLKDIQQW